MHTLATVAALNPYADFSPTMFLVFFLVGLVLAAFMFWGVFTKAGYPGWASIVPFYNLIVLAKIGGKEWWWGLLAIIPYIGLVFLIIICIGVAKNFGKDWGWGIGLALLGIIFFPILGYGSAEYRGPKPAPAT